MKRYILIGAAALALAITGCSGGVFIDPGYDLANGGNGSGVNGGNSGGTSFNPNVDSKIVGTWEAADTTGSMYFEFKANGKWAIWYSFDEYSDSGTFTAKNGVLTIWGWQELEEEQKGAYKIEENGAKLTLIITEESIMVLYKSGKNSGGNSGDVDPQIVGTWWNYNVPFVFNADGTGSGYRNETPFTCNFTAKNGVLTIKTSTGIPETYRYAMNKFILTLTGADNETRYCCKGYNDGGNQGVDPKIVGKWQPTKTDHSSVKFESNGTVTTYNSGDGAGNSESKFTAKDNILVVYHDNSISVVESYTISGNTLTMITMTVRPPRTETYTKVQE